MRPAAAPTVALAACLAAGLFLATGARGLESQTPTNASTKNPPVIAGSKHRAGFFPALGRGVVNILVIGSDARPGEDVLRMRADSIHIMSINLDQGAGTILGFPRDSYINIPGYGTSKINDAMVAGGPERLVDTVESLTGIPIDHWLATSFQGFSDLVDAIGGLDVEVAYSMYDSLSGTHFDPGLNHFAGGDALAFARDRHSASNGDFSRSENQGRLLLAGLEKLHRVFTSTSHRLLIWVAAGMRETAGTLSVQQMFDLALTATRVDPSKVRNIVAPGSVGYAGAASVVFLTSEAQAVFADVRDDGILQDH